MLEGVLVKEPSPNVMHQRVSRRLQRLLEDYFWIVDPEQKTLECFALRDGLYALVTAGMDDDVVKHPDFAGLSIVLKNKGYFPRSSRRFCPRTFSRSFAVKIFSILARSYSGSPKGKSLPNKIRWTP